MSRLTNLELNDLNTGSESKRCILLQDFTSALFNDDIPREVAITRFKIPITLMDLMIIDNSNDPDYMIQFEADILVTPLVQTYTNLGTAYLQSTTINRILSPNDFIEYVNRALARAHRDVMRFFTSFRKNHSFSAGRFRTGHTTERNLAISAAGLTQCYYVKLVLDGFTVINQSGNEVNLVNIDLKSPSGVSCRVASSVLLQSGKVYIFENAGINSYSYAKNSDNTLDSTYSITPMESFLKFKEEAIDGNWKLVITTPGLGSIDININAELEVSSPANGSFFRFPNQPPIVDFDSDGFISWHIPERFLFNDFRIKLGNKLNSILSYHKIAHSSGYVKFPILTFSTNLDQIVSLKQEANRLYNIVQPERIQISLFGLNIDRDLNNDLNPSTAITSFLLPSDEVIKFMELSYNTDASVKPYRRYRLQNMTNLNRFTISVEVVYKNGVRRDLYMESGASFNLMLSFFEVS